MGGHQRGGPAARTHSAPVPSSGLRPFAVLLLLSATWLLALLFVNSDTLLFHYLFAASNCVQVPARALPREATEPCVAGSVTREVR